ncbi:glycine/betaine ABC transporter substrate-binding protein [Paenibacillus sp. 7124]|uniref:Glycine/betaine ABC transporter substrate-binding protein n=2 Tax=Paenibacillus apii TaxID=1850370 RepID=A0A6M1PKE8_9BACL|nr:glycine/betaine ABC transporter substrate-binding protein [Paenibacillus apii]NJJ39580.1 glycine/betaine ABC transporter substrate-binding protein [Paenibacillus apii]
MSVVVLLSACSSGGSGSSSEQDGKPTIKIGSKTFTEQYVLGELYAQALEEKGFKVDRKLNLGDTLVVFEALKNGEVDLYPEYSGTSYMEILKEDPSKELTSEFVYDTVKKKYKENWDIDTLEQTPFNNTYVLVTSDAIAKKHGLQTLSDVAMKAPELNFGMVPAFAERDDGLPGLKKKYGGFEFKSSKLFDFGLKYQALSSGQVDVTVGTGTDGQIAAYKLVVLKDDKGLWPPYHVAPQIRGELLKAYPEIGDIINGIDKLLTDEVMSGLNWEVEGDKKREPKDVAREFLKEHGIVK